MKPVIICAMLLLGSAIRHELDEKKITVVVNNDGDTEYYAAPTSNSRKGDGHTAAAGHADKLIVTADDDFDINLDDLEGLEFDDDDLKQLFGEVEEDIVSPIEVSQPSGQSVNLAAVSAAQELLQKSQLKSAKSVMSGGDWQMTLISQQIESPLISTSVEKHAKALEHAPSVQKAAGGKLAKASLEQVASLLESKSAARLSTGLRTGVEVDMTGDLKMNPEQKAKWKEDRATMWRNMLKLPCHPSHGYEGTTKCCCYRLPARGTALNISVKTAHHGYERETHDKSNGKKSLLNEYAYHEARAYIGHCWRDVEYNNVKGPKAPDGEGSPNEAGLFEPPFVDGVRQEDIAYNGDAGNKHGWMATTENRGLGGFTAGDDHGRNPRHDPAKWGPDGGTYFARYCGTCYDEERKNMCKSLDKMMGRFGVPDNIGGSGW